MKTFRGILKQSSDLVRLARWFRVRSLKRVRRNSFEGYFRTSTCRKLQLGSGSNELPGWLNTDGNWSVSNAKYLDITEPFPFGDNSFHHIFCEHTIEHIHYNQARAMLLECFRVLSPGGKIRLATPDLKAYLCLYHPEAEAILGDCVTEKFNKNILPGFHAAAHYQPITEQPDAVFVINDIFRNYEHKFIYDYQTLAALLRHAGFNDVTCCEVGASQDEVLCGLETHKDRINGFLTVVVEATKPEPRHE